MHILKKSMQFSAVFYLMALHTSNSPNFEAISRCKQSGHWQRAVFGLFFSLVPPQFQNKDSQIKMRNEDLTQK